MVGVRCLSAISNRTDKVHVDSTPHGCFLFRTDEVKSFGAEIHEVHVILRVNFAPRRFTNP